MVREWQHKREAPHSTHTHTQTTHKVCRQNPSPSLHIKCVDRTHPPPSHTTSSSMWTRHQTQSQHKTVRHCRGQSLWQTPYLCAMNMQEQATHTHTHIHTHTHSGLYMYNATTPGCVHTDAIITPGNTAGKTLPKCTQVSHSQYKQRLLWKKTITSSLKMKKDFLPTFHVFTDHP